MATPCIVTAMNRHGFGSALHTDIDKARAEMIEAFDEGKCDNMLVMFIIPVKEAASD